MRSFKVNLTSVRKCEVQLESDFPISIDQARDVLTRTRRPCLGKKTKNVERETLIDSGQVFSKLAESITLEFSLNL